MAKENAKKSRLAGALRANLHRRKAQSRAHQAEDTAQIKESPLPQTEIQEKADENSISR